MFQEAVPMKALIQLRSLIVPVMIVLVLGTVACWYDLIWLPSEYRYLDNRNFRLLTTLSDQISATINNFDSMMDNAAESGVTDDGLDAYLKIVAPQVERVDLDNRDARTDNYGDPPRMAVRADEGSHFLYFDFERKDEKTHAETKYAIRTDLERLVRKTLPPDNRNPFEVLLVAQGDGTVIFQNSASGIAVARVNALEDTTTAKAVKPENEEKSPPESDNYSFSKLREIKLAGDRFRLYSQPLRISLPPMDPSKEGALPEHWIVCGLVRVETFRAESQSISTTYILWTSVAILLVLAAYPFLKLRISSPAERLRAADLVVTAILSCVATTTLTFALLDVYYTREVFGLEESKDPMRAIAVAIDHNFEKERQDAIKQLNEFDVDDTLPSVLGYEQMKNEDQPTFNKNGDGCDPASACKTSILKEGILKKDGEIAWTYPYLELASWNDSKGLQQIKWATRGHVTPFIKLDDRSIPYYPAIKKALTYSTTNKSVPRDGVGNQFSPNTGDYITVFWQVPDTGDKGKGALSASIVTRPVSVVNPILPADFGFAIIRSDGMVVYHSDPTRNLRENFFAETDQDQEVRSRVSTRAEGELVAKYMGRGHRLYIYPMTHDATKSWTVVVFRDLRLEETMNLEVVSLASILFVLYALTFTIAMLVWHRTGRGQVTGSWLWPNSRKAKSYGWLTAMNSAGVVLLLVLPMLPGVIALLLCAVGIPVGAMTLNVLELRRRDVSTRSEETPGQLPDRWQLKYYSTLSSLLMVAAVMPCLSFFKVGWDFEQRILIERSQLRLTVDLDDRQERVRAHYVDVDLGPDVRKKLLAYPDEGPGQYSSYHNGFLNTKIDHVATAQSSAACDFGSACAQQKVLATFLSWASPLYNEIAYDGRYMTMAMQKDPIWASQQSLGQEVITMTVASHDADKRRLTITSCWTPMCIPWGDWKWWLGAFACSVALFWLVRFSLKRIFLLDLKEPDWKLEEPCQPAEWCPKDLIAKLPLSVVIIGRGSSPTIVRLIQRNDVQAHDLFEMLTAPAAKFMGPGSASRNKAAEIAENIKKNSARKVVFYNFERGLADPNIHQEMLSTVERVLSTPVTTVVIVSTVDPCSKLTGDEREQWQKLLQVFVRIDLNGGPAKGGNETSEAFEARVSEDGYNNWLFSGRPEGQKLVLVQLAEEGLVNPNSRPDVRELMKDGFLARENGMLAIRDRDFWQFLRKNASSHVIQDLESHFAVRSNTLRMSLLAAGVAGMVFLFSTQGAMVNTWITYATGLAAAIPALIKVFEQIGSRSGGSTP
jgi:hypothetical protein